MYVDGMRPIESARPGAGGPSRPGVPDAAPTVVRERIVPEAIRSLDTLPSPDYVDLFSVPTGEVEDTPAEDRAAEPGA